MDAVLYKLDTFEGPLDLLLTLIQKNKVRLYYNTRKRTGKCCFMQEIGV